MNRLRQETRNVQNPALGAMLLWRFAVGYERGSGAGRPAPIPLLFLVLPIMLHEETARFVTSTQKPSGLRAFADKFVEARHSKSDLVFAIHKRSLEMRKLTMDSLALAVGVDVILLDCDHGVAMALSSTPVKAGIASSVRTMLRAADKLGAWCSAISLHEVSIILKVEF